MYDKIPPEDELNEVSEIPAEDELNGTLEIPPEDELNEVSEIPTEDELNGTLEMPTEDELNEVSEIPTEDELNEVSEMPTEDELNEISEITSDEDLQNIENFVETTDILDDSDQAKIQEFKISEDEIEQILAISKTYNVNPNMLVKFMLENECSISRIKNIIEKTKGQLGLTQEEDFSLQRASNSFPDVSMYQPSNKPFSFRDNSTEIINVNTGALIFTDHIVSLKGKNGLDLNLSFIYDSSEAVQDWTYGRIDKVGLFEGNRSPFSVSEDKDYPLPMSYHMGIRRNSIADIAAGWRLNTTQIIWENYIENVGGTGPRNIEEFKIKLPDGNTYQLETEKMDILK